MTVESEDTAEYSEFALDILRREILSIADPRNGDEEIPALGAVPPELTIFDPDVYAEADHVLAQVPRMPTNIHMAVLRGATHALTSRRLYTEGPMAVRTRLRTQLSELTGLSSALGSEVLAVTSLLESAEIGEVAPHDLSPEEVARWIFDLELDFYLASAALTPAMEHDFSDTNRILLHGREDAWADFWDSVFDELHRLKYYP